MSDSRNDDETVTPEGASNAGDLSEAGAQFDDELRDAQAEADDEFKA